MQTMIDPEQFVGVRGNVEPRDDDDFTNEFAGLCIGVRNGFLQVRDADDAVFEIGISQFTPNAKGERCAVAHTLHPIVGSSDFGKE